MSVEFTHSASSAFDTHERSLLHRLAETIGARCLLSLRAGILGLVSSLVCLGIVGIPAIAQVVTGDVLGTVTDESGAVIPGAKITLTNLGTGIKQTAQSNEAGEYTFNLLQPGSFSVEIEAPGFKKVVYANVALAAGDRLREDGKMQSGTVEQTVEVDATPPLLQTDSSTVSSVVTQQAVQDLPLNGRNFINLVTIQAGVNQGPPNAISSGTRPDDRRQSSTVSANGQSDLFNNEMIDGMDNNEREQGFIGVRPSIDAIAEVKVDTNTFTADTGRDAGAVVNIITKTGTNAYHGSVYEFFRNDIFDAKSYGFGNNLPKSEYRQNQFGGSMGGPIKKNKTFFFADVGRQPGDSGIADNSLYSTHVPGKGTGIRLCDPNRCLRFHRQRWHGSAYRALPTR